MSVACGKIRSCTRKSPLTPPFGFPLSAFSTKRTRSYAVYRLRPSGTGALAAAGIASGRAAARRITCPRCHARAMDESSYAYLLGLYLGDGHIVHGPRDVYVLAIACSDDWPGLMTAARQAMAAVMPTSSVCGVKQTGCTMIKSYSKHWACLFPQHGPGDRK